MIGHALSAHASDVHVDPSGTDAVIRFRVDGHLCIHETIPTLLHESLILYVKSRARLRTDVHALPHDGRITLGQCDVRVSLMPVAHGENIVLRILHRRPEPPSLRVLGFSDLQILLLTDAIHRTSGIVCIAGPTGSGKTTTLYSLLHEVLDVSRAVVTLEDPIEYTMCGVRQIPVAPHLGFTFATGLRSVLRQDPDILMVGEIRDSETALLACQAALTGHLVLTTVHAATTERALSRLKNLGISDFLLAETVVRIVAQRLVRTFIHDSVTGRQVLCEMMSYTHGIFSLETPSLQMHGRELVSSGITTAAEVNRVLQ